MLQELTDLDFDTYFDVATTTNQSQQQQQSNRDILHHDNSSAQQQQAQQNANITSLSSLLNNTNNTTNNRQSSFQYSQDQQNFNLFDWDLNPTTTNSSENQSPMQISPISSPQSSSDGYTLHSLSPQMSPPLYAYNNNNDNQHIKAASKALEGFFAKRSLYSSLVHTVPGINIPTTPINENPPISASTNLPSPPLNNPLSGAFSAIDQWCQLKGQGDIIHPLDMNNDNDEHQTRHWRKTSARYQQLQQSQSNTLNNRPEPGKQLKKVAHNAIERRYRNNINDRIRELKNVVPALYKARIHEKGDDDSSDSGDEQEEMIIVDGVEVAKKLNKATILKKATEYIQFLKNTNDTTEKENLILQQIIAQMPRGQDVLTHFLRQKNEFERSEQDRLARERREAQEREKMERQRILRERAAQRAALAQLLPKPERRPYRRRQSSKNNAAKSKKASLSSASDDDHTGNNKMFMAVFMCVAFFSSSPITSSSFSMHHNSSHDNQTAASNSYSSSTASPIDFWQIIRYTLCTIGILYICLIPLLLRWLRPHPVVRRLNTTKKCSCDHHHYAEEVPTAWNRLYTNLVSIVNKSSTINKTNEKEEEEKNHSTTKYSTLYNMIRHTLVFLVPHSLLAFISRNAKSCPEELSFIGAWIRLNEVECLGGNPDITRLGMLHTCLGMLAQLHKLKRDECEANTMARVYATIAIQFELFLPVSISSLIVPYCWKRVAISKKPEEKSSQQECISTQWLNSPCHDQVIQILSIRNGFTPSEEYSNGACRNSFLSFVLPYITSPLDLVLYWQQLNNLQQNYLSYLDGTRSVFTKKQLKQVLDVSTTTTAPGHMLQWFVRVGLTLQSLGKGGQAHQENLDALAEYTRTKVPQVNSHPTSNLLRRHQTMIYHLMEAATALQSNINSDQVPQYIQEAAKDRRASMECIQQIDLSDNYEASVLVISTLAVHLRTLKALIIHQQTTCSLTNKRSSVINGGNNKLPADQASIYIAELRDQLLQDVKSPYARSLSAKCRDHIQSYIYQADDTLSV